ncbi:hypothetical protein TTHERM_000992712 (macronuclear) [Tetrahymena thermophila SB210]|uniref:Uncharacterized protein n=1 Tax=Tetrahymena thermophila (strain SB210) TaxID=312017 RepID=W7XD35_TETTS|nr:hypothetical protein TTHERM_000992712 [Tetrahymena thermophila SB210]EWS71726.1 hypothetical protein TTHERM_000992712 [Tetrahymena thermophila SB210]|eukprot:XP_012655734.1 hypothetical protein TTHERM_000992712 [Tetrahymena thermophila SB210]
MNLIDMVPIIEQKQMNEKRIKGKRREDQDINSKAKKLINRNRRNQNKKSQLKLKYKKIKKERKQNFHKDINIYQKWLRLQLLLLLPPDSGLRLLSLVSEDPSTPKTPTKLSLSSKTSTPRKMLLSIKERELFTFTRVKRRTVLTTEPSGVELVRLTVTTVLLLLDLLTTSPLKLLVPSLELCSILTELELDIKNINFLLQL